MSTEQQGGTHQYQMATFDSVERDTEVYFGPRDATSSQAAPFTQSVCTVCTTPHPDHNSPHLQRTSLNTTQNAQCIAPVREQAPPSLLLPQPPAKTTLYGHSVTSSELW
ncbi:hypothetical protein Tcan_14941 [Toxocara canis]|uniref:Uncharacterized protein n=1 Tax=Toxocara canis TaxID=6265 RepID=A0A0B2V5B8_TOXCA|nr:hypothetical protein Tcan_14941 [Toxocara canis]